MPIYENNSDIDDFEYWLELVQPGQEKLFGKNFNMIKGAMQQFAGTLQELGFYDVELHFFPFDTRTIAITFGNLADIEDIKYMFRYFAITLEHLVIKVKMPLITTDIRITTWLQRNGERIFLEEPFGKRVRMKGKIIEYGVVIEKQKHIPIKDLYINLCECYEDHLKEGYDDLPSIRRKMRYLL